VIIIKEIKMELLKELFSFDGPEEDTEGSKEEFDFDFEDDSDELNFDGDFARGGDTDYEEDESEDYDSDEFPDLDGMGSEEDYPETMNDMPSMDEDDMEDEVDAIRSEIEDLYSRLGKLAAAGDLNLYDDSLTGDEDDNEEMGMEDDMEFDPRAEMGLDDGPEMGFDSREEMGFDDEDDLPL
jgi:hypothetical protein